MAAQYYCKSNNYSPENLFDSILSGEVSRIQAILKEDVNIDVRDSKDRTPLLFACSHRRERIADLLIKSGANVECCDEKKCTVMHYSSGNGWIEIVETVAEIVSNLETRDNRGETPLHHASRSGHLNVVKCLFVQGADIDPKNSAGFTPLICAAQCSRKDVFCQLLKFGAKVDNEGLLLYYACRSNWPEIIQFLVKRVPDLDGRYMTNEKNLEESIEHLEVVKFLMGEGTDMNSQNKMIGPSALLVASYLGHLEVVKWLVKRLPELNKRGCFGQTALHYASIGGNLEIMKCLVEEGADINARDERGQTALHKASAKGYLERVKYLVEKEADINVKSFDGDTPLLCATGNDRKDVVDFLLNLGANVDGLILNRFTMLHLASFHGRVDIVQSLVKRGCDLDARAVLGFTPLYIACKSRKLDVVQSLLQAGASWDIEDIDGNSPLNYLTRQEMTEFKFIKLFIENGAYLKHTDYNRLVKSSSLEVLQHVKLSSKAIINKFNNHSLPELYKLPVSGSLPRIEEMKIVNGSEIAQTIERTVGIEIQTKGHCNILEARPMVLSIFSVGSILDYYKKKTLKFKQGLKRQAAFDSVNNFQHLPKSICLSRETKLFVADRIQ